MVTTGIERPVVTSSTNLDLPVPTSPTSSITPPIPSDSRRSSAVCTTASSASRPTKGSSSVDRVLAITELTAHRVGVDLGALALDRERLELDGLEHGRRSVEHGRGGVELTRRGRGHQPGREVHRVAHDGVGGAEGRADLTGEDMASVDADLDREGGRGIDDGPQGPQHPPLVLLHRDRHTGGQDELSAVGVDVRGEEADPLALGRVLHDPGHLVEGGGHRIGPEPIVELVDPLVLHEGHDADAVFGLDLTGLQVAAQADRDAAHHRLDRNVAAGREGRREPPEACATSAPSRPPWRRWPRPGGGRRGRRC